MVASIVSTELSAPSKPVVSTGNLIDPNYTAANRVDCGLQKIQAIDFLAIAV